MPRGEVILGSSLPFVALDARWQSAKSRCKFLDNVRRKTVTCAECHYLYRTSWIVVGYVTPGIPVLTPHRRNHCTARMHEASRIPAGPRGVFLGPRASLPPPFWKCPLCATRRRSAAQAMNDSDP